MYRVEESNSRIHLPDMLCIFWSTIPRMQCLWRPWLPPMGKGQGKVKILQTSLGWMLTPQPSAGSAAATAALHTALCLSSKPKFDLVLLLDCSCCVVLENEIVVVILWMLEYMDCPPTDGRECHHSAYFELLIWLEVRLSTNYREKSSHKLRRFKTNWH